MTTMSTITVRVHRTIQVKQYEPVTVDLSQTLEVNPDSADSMRLALYKSLTKDLERFITNEVRKARAAAKEED